MSRLVEALTTEAKTAVAPYRHLPLNADNIFNEISTSDTTIGTRGGAGVSRMISDYASNMFAGVVTGQFTISAHFRYDWEYINSHTLAIADDKHIQVWDISSEPECTLSLAHPQNCGTVARLLRCGENLLLAVYTRHAAMAIWDTFSGTRIRFHFIEKAKECFVVPDTLCISPTSPNELLMLIQCPHRKILSVAKVTRKFRTRELSGHQFDLSTCVFMPDGKAVSCDGGGFVKIWNTTRYECISTIDTTLSIPETMHVVIRYETLLMPLSSRLLLCFDTGTCTTRVFDVTDRKDTDYPQHTYNTLIPLALLPQGPFVMLQKSSRRKRMRNGARMEPTPYLFRYLDPHTGALLDVSSEIKVPRILRSTDSKHVRKLFTVLPSARAIVIPDKARGGLQVWHFGEGTDNRSFTGVVEHGSLITFWPENVSNMLSILPLPEGRLLMRSIADLSFTKQIITMWR